MKTKHNLPPINIGIFILITLASFIIEHIIKFGLSDTFSTIYNLGFVKFSTMLNYRYSNTLDKTQFLLSICGIWILLFSFYYYFFYSKSNASAQEESTMKELSEKIKDYELEFPKFIFTRILVYLAYAVGVGAFFYSAELNLPLFKITAILCGIICFLFAEAIKVILDIEANTRITAERSAGQLEVLIMIQKANMNRNNAKSSLVDSYIYYCENCGEKNNSNSVACSSCSSIFNFNESELSEKRKSLQR